MSTNAVRNRSEAEPGEAKSCKTGGQGQGEGYKAQGEIQ